MGYSRKILNYIKQLVLMTVSSQTQVFGSKKADNSQTKTTKQQILRTLQ